MYSGGWTRPSLCKADHHPSWWFQPIWKILVKSQNWFFPQVGVKIKNIYIWNHHPASFWDSTLYNSSKLQAVQTANVAGWTLPFCHLSCRSWHMVATPLSWLQREGLGFSPYHVSLIFWSTYHAFDCISLIVTKCIFNCPLCPVFTCGHHHDSQGATFLAQNHWSPTWLWSKRWASAFGCKSIPNLMIIIIHHHHHHDYCSSHCHHQHHCYCYSHRDHLCQQLVFLGKSLQQMADDFQLWMVCCCQTHCTKLQPAVEFETMLTSPSHLSTTSSCRLSLGILGQQAARGHCAQLCAVYLWHSYSKYWLGTPWKSKTKQRMVFGMIHVKDSLLPMGKVRSLDFLGTYKGYSLIFPDIKNVANSKCCWNNRGKNSTCWGSNLATKQAGWSDANHHFWIQKLWPATISHATNHGEDSPRFSGKNDESHDINSHFFRACCTRSLGKAETICIHLCLNLCISILSTMMPETQWTDVSTNTSRSTALSRHSSLASASLSSSGAPKLRRWITIWRKIQKILVEPHLLEIYFSKTQAATEKWIHRSINIMTRSHPPFGSRPVFSTGLPWYPMLSKEESRRCRLPQKNSAAISQPFSTFRYVPQKGWVVIMIIYHWQLHRNCDRDVVETEIIRVGWN